jgi:hypothetical protein
MTPPNETASDSTQASGFAKMQAEDMANESRILWSEIGVMAFLALLVAIYLVVA